MAKLDGGLGFLEGCDVLAEVIESGEVAGCVELPGDAHDVVEGLAGYEAGGEFLRERRSFHPAAQVSLTGQKEKRLPKHEYLLPRYTIVWM